MWIPNKSQKGLNIRKWLVETVDALIECIMWMRIRPGPGISVKEGPAGTIVSLSGQAGHPQTAVPAAMVRAGEGIRIDNGTASSVYVPGGTVSAVPVNGAIFTCLQPGGGAGDEPVYFWFGSAYAAEDAIIQVQPNRIYCINEEYGLSSDYSTYGPKFNTAWFQVNYPDLDTDDHEGNVLVLLPVNLTASCWIRIYVWHLSSVTVIAPDGKHIYSDDGTNTDSSERLYGGSMHLYVYQPSENCWRSLTFT